MRKITPGEHFGQFAKGFCFTGKLSRADVRMVPVFQHKNFLQFRWNTDASFRCGSENLIPMVMGEVTAQLENCGPFSLKFYTCR
ncbi:MAG: hypothetical protein K0Q55_1960 [Verrucomicrobia bacterium]|nr:hypothetical protein [Verrucomicrobiota bacterium]